LRSTDGGITWKALPGFPSVTNLDSVAVDPTNSNILYAATQPLGVLKSTDGGVTWAGANNGIPTFSQETTTVYGFPGSATGRDAYQIWADPESPGLLFVSTSTNALMRSTDGGASWSPVALRAQNWGKQVSDPFSKETIYAPASGSFYKSTDDGQTWTALAALPDASLTNAIAADPAHQGTLYGGSNTGLFQSTDSGKTWTRKIAGNTSLITSDPQNGSMFAEVAGLGIVASTNGFTTYKSISPVSTFTQ
jgi:photosystem II stability/assembly factor-like uncharacterized protein